MNVFIIRDSYDPSKQYLLNLKGNDDQWIRSKQFGMVRMSKGQIWLSDELLKNKIESYDSESFGPVRTYIYIYIIICICEYNII